MFKIDNKDLKALEQTLKKLNRRGIPFAVRNTLNSMAFEARGLARANIRRNFTLRNAYTVRGVVVERADEKEIRNMIATTGHVEDYMRLQEYGGYIKAKGKHGVVIPTGWSAGQRGVIPRTRMPRKPNRVSNIVLGRAKRRVKTGDKNKAAFETVKAAARARIKNIFLETNKTKGFFRIMGTKNKPRLRMVAEAKRKAVRVPPRPWLTPAATKAARLLEPLYRRHLLAQIMRAAKR